MTIASVGLRARARGGQRRGAEARGMDAAHRDPPRRTRPRVRPAGRAVPGAAGPGSVVGERFVTNEQVRKIVFTGSTEVGKHVMAGCAEQVKPVTLELGGKSANVVFADSDLEKAAASAPVRGVRKRRAGLLRAQPHPRRAQCLRSVPGVARAGGQGRQGRRARATRPPRWVRWSRRRTSTRSRRIVDDEHPVAFRGTAPDGAGFWFPPTVLLPTRAPIAPSPTRSSDRSSPCCRSTTRPTRSPRQRQHLRSVRLDLDQRCRPGHPRRARDRDRQPVGQLALVGSLLDPLRRFKQSGLGRELGPDAASAFTETKNVFIAS